MSEDTLQSIYPITITHNDISDKILEPEEELEINSEIDESYYFDLPQLCEEHPYFIQLLTLRYSYYLDKGDYENAKKQEQISECFPVRGYDGNDAAGAGAFCGNRHHREQRIRSFDSRHRLHRAWSRTFSGYRLPCLYHPRKQL